MSETTGISGASRRRADEAATPDIEQTATGLKRAIPRSLFDVVKVDDRLLAEAARNASAPRPPFVIGNLSLYTDDALEREIDAARARLGSQRGPTADAERQLIDRAEAELARRREPKLVDVYSYPTRADVDAAIAAESNYLARFRGCIGPDVRAKHERQLEALEYRREQMNFTERACDGAKPTLVAGLPHGAYGAAVTADDLVAALGRRVPLDAKQEAQVRSAFEAWRQRACLETGSDPTRVVARDKHKELRVDTAAREAEVARKYLEIIDAIRGSALAAAAFLDSTARGESLDGAHQRVRATSILGDVALTLPAAPGLAHPSSGAPSARGADSTRPAAADGSAPPAPAPRRPPPNDAVGQVSAVGPPPPKARAPVEKFSEYVFKEGATHGKDAVFRGLGYGKEHSAELARTWEEQAAAKHARGEYTLGKADQYGQRINIEIEVHGIGDAAGKTSYMQSGWMILPDGSIKLNTPFSGFTR